MHSAKTVVAPSHARAGITYGPACKAGTTRLIGCRCRRLRAAVIEEPGRRQPARIRIVGEEQSAALDPVDQRPRHLKAHGRASPASTEIALRFRERFTHVPRAV